MSRAWAGQQGPCASEPGGRAAQGLEILLQAGSPRALRGCPGRQGACRRVALTTA